MFGDVLIALLVALVTGWLAAWARQPPLVGYILGGMLMGPYVLGGIRDLAFLDQLAEIGVVFLLFVVGVRLSIGELTRLGWRPLWMAILHLSLMVALGVGAAVQVGQGPLPGLLWGLMLGFSSTVVVLKILSDRHELGSQHGRLMTAMLVVQDLAVLPAMALLSLGGEAAGWRHVLFVLFKALVFVGGLVAVSLRVVPPFLRWVASVQSREVFLLAVVALSLGTAWLALILGLPPALGAFVAGLMVSESPFGHQVFSDALPFRDLFAALFFVSIGALVDPAVVTRYGGVIAGLVLFLLLVKGGLFALLARMARYPPALAVWLGLGLFQVGEFSFLLARTGRDSGLLGTDAYAIFLATALLTMLLTAPSFGWAARLVSRQLPIRRQPSMMRGHAVLLGYGRVGRLVGGFLRAAGIPVMVVDLDPRLVHHLCDDGFCAMYGDASRPEVLSRAGVEEALWVVVALPDPVTTRLAVQAVRRLNPDVAVFVRVHQREEVARLRELGATEVVLPEERAGQALAALVLGHEP